MDSSGSAAVFINSSPGGGDTVVFDNGAGTNTSISLTTVLYPSSITVSSSNNYSFSGSGSIAGPGGLTVKGPGALTITTSNSYTGTTSIGGGTLQLGVGTSGLDGSINGTSGVANNAALVYNLDGNQTASYVISGSGSVSKLGPGALTLSGSNGYSGGTFVNAGLLLTGNPRALGAGDVTLAAGSALALNSNLAVGSLSGNGGTVSLGAYTLTVGGDNNSPPAYSGIISGTGSLTKTGSGVLTLNGSNTYTGNTVVSGGTVDLTNGSLYSSAYNTARVTVQSGGVLIANQLQYSASSSLGELTYNTYEVYDTMPTAGSPIPATAHLVLDNGSIQWVGPTELEGHGFIVTVNGGTINVANPAATITIYQTSLAHPGAQDIFIFGPLTLTGAGNGVIQDKIINGTGSVIKSGTGTWTLSSSGDYTGGVIVSNGVLQIGNSAALGVGSLAVNGGTLDLGGYGATVYSFSGAAGVVTNSGSNSATLTTNQGGTTTFSGSLQNGASQTALTMNGSGTNNYGANGGGTIVNAGTLIADNASAQPDGSSLTVGQDASSIFAPALASPALAGPAGVVAVPEPGTLALLIAAVWSAAIYRRFTKRPALG